jgi:hypothetical protein
VATRVKVECVNKTNRTDPHERIHNIGGRNPDGNRWRLAEAEAIAGIEEGKWSFYVERPIGHTVEVIIATRQSKKYLKTTADGQQPDNLLALPECPA